MTRGWLPKEVLDPRGAWGSVALVRKGNPARASIAQNVRFSPGVVRTRGAMVGQYGVTGAVSSMFNWISPTANVLLFHNVTTVRQRVIATGANSVLASGITGTASFADLGSRVYFCAFDATGTGTTQCRVYDGTNTDTAFRAPLQVVSATAVDGGTGRCTKGTHKLGFIFQSRSGFSGKPSPVNSGDVFSPASVTLLAGNRKITYTITLNTPADAGIDSLVYPIMTRADNPNEWYFVPGMEVAIPASASGWVQVFSISASDEDLTAVDTVEIATSYFDLLSQVQAGIGPFNPSAVFAYGKRMCYAVGMKLYVSEIDDPQHLTGYQNVIEMPSKRKITTGFILNGSEDLYLIGEKWTARIKDNGNYPSTWAQPVNVSDSIGTPAVKGVEYRTIGPYAWVASEAGVFVFNGVYPSRPITYLESANWKRINWAYASTIQVRDDVTNLKCYVAVPLDSAVEKSHVFVIDYTNGLTYDTCDISIDKYDAATFGSIEVVKEASTSSVLWAGPSATGSVGCISAATLGGYGDSLLGVVAAPIHSIWKSGLVRESGELNSKCVFVGDADIWIRGNGALIQTWFGQDGIVSFVPNLLADGFAATILSAAPGIEYLSQVDLHPVENFYAQFETNALSAWFELSGFKAHTKPSLYSR